MQIDVGVLTLYRIVMPLGTSLVKSDMILCGTLIVDYS